MSCRRHIPDHVDTTPCAGIEPTTSCTPAGECSTTGPSGSVSTELEMAHTYKYMGVYLNENLDFINTGESLDGATGKAIMMEKVIAKFNDFRNIGFLTHGNLYSNGIVYPIFRGLGVWQNRFM